MAVVVITEHAAQLRGTPPMEVLGPEIALSKKVTIGAETDSTVMASSGLKRIWAEAACCIAHGPPEQTAQPLSAANPSTPFSAGMVEVRWMDAGDEVSVVAA
jgi:hypothetical protein